MLSSCWFPQGNGTSENWVSVSYVSHSLYSVPTQEEIIGNLIVFLVVVLVFFLIFFLSVLISWCLRYRGVRPLEMIDSRVFLARIWTSEFCQAINKHRLIYIFIKFIFARLQAFQVSHILWSKCQQGHSKKYRNSQKCFPVTETYHFRSKVKREWKQCLGPVASRVGEDLYEFCGCVTS